MLATTRFFPLTSPHAAAEPFARSRVSQANPSREIEAAKDLEATFLSMLLKEMRQTLEEDGLFPGDSGDVQGGLFDLYLGKFLADSGGVGLVAALERTRQNTYAPVAKHGPDTPRGSITEPPSR